MAHDPRLRAAEKKIQKLFARIDERLEDKYGDRYPLHPARAPRGATPNPQFSGLFDVGAAFSAGFGSKYGPGYILEVRMVTLSEVPAKVRRAIEDEAAEMLRAELPKVFPDRELLVERDGPVYKIFGDLRIGSL